MITIAFELGASARATVKDITAERCAAASA
jgi:hypothetical protein